MVTTRTQEDFANNPAFEAAVQQTVNVLLPNLSAQIREEVRQEMANASNGSGGSGGGNPPENIHTWLESVVTSPDDAEHWIAYMEKIFEVLGCRDIYKARLATYKFEGDALNWWKTYKGAKGGNDWVATLSWNTFCEIFFFQYFPLSEKEKFEREETSTEFMKRFVRLAGFLGDKAGTPGEQAKKFQWALKKDLLDGVVNMHFDDVAGVANAVRNIEIAEETAKQGGNDRRVFDTRGSDMQGNDRRGYDYRGYDRQNDRRGFDARGSDRQGYSSGRDQQQRGQQDYRALGSSRQERRVNTCKTCGKSHPGRQCHRISGACFNCS
ncbi:zinc finger, CCHC-type, Retrotransposon gag domain protein [Artemisia annua]|uniref:Zinc finger, CCHC-type, Retrotransposon gag domain protein n=1 Tax=Artemisia annua TaxID=35608 RepID=A0A2U1KQ55_ARTAN|nr:zinc finger, CCHC-type, Retrotransposon gag domain protein [Artemisia annua]